MTQQTRLWLVSILLCCGIFGAGYMARGAVDRYRAADRSSGLTVDGDTFTWKNVPEHLTLSCTTAPKSNPAFSELGAASAPCYPVVALAPVVAHEFAQALHTSVEALMGVEKCP